MSLIRPVLIFFFCLSLPQIAAAQNSGKWIQDSIKTSAHCEYCKREIEAALLSVKGVKKAEVDLDRGLVRLIYKRDKVNPDSLRSTLSKMGYDADDIPAQNKIIQRRKDPCFKRID
jgi:mercuric ion binding protein